MTKRRNTPGKGNPTLDSLLREASACEKSGKLGEADGLYRQVLRRDPRHASALDRLALMEFRAGKTDSALTLLRRATAARATPEFLSHLGVVLAASGQVDEAIDAYRRGLALAPAVPELHNNLGNSLRRKGAVVESEAAFREAIRLAPTYGEAHNNLALLLRDLGRLDEGVQLLTHLVAMKPDYGQAWDNLGNFHIAAGRIDQALPCFRRAFELMPNSPAVMVNMAVGLTKTGRFSEAPGLYRGALARDPSLIEARVGLANCLAHEGKPAEAAAELRAALAIDPNFVPAYQNLQDLPGGEITEQQFGHLESLLASKGLRPEYRSALMFLLARWHERSGRYDRAFDLVSQANRMERPTIQFSAEAEADFLRRTAGVFDQAFFQANTVRGSESELPIFVLGLPRSGTTLVEQILASHPRVAGAGEVIEMPEISKRLPALLGTEDKFPECVRRLDQARAAEAAEGYLSVLRSHAGTAERVVDKLPFNFRLLGLIALLLPRARIIHCRRDPRDTAISCFFIHFHRPISFAYDLRDFAAYYRLYEGLMAHWHRVLPLPILDLQYEDLVAAPEPKIREMLDFCGLDWDARCLSFQDTNRAIRTASMWQVRKPLYASSIGRWRRYEKHIQPFLREIAAVAGPPQRTGGDAAALAATPTASRIVPEVAPRAAEPMATPGTAPKAVPTTMAKSAPPAGGSGPVSVRAGPQASQPPLARPTGQPAAVPMGGVPQQAPKPALRPAPNPWDGAVAEALALSGKGMHAEAEQRLLALQRERPNVASIWYALGLVAYQRGDFKAAEPLFQRALELDPDNGSYCSALGVIYRNLKQTDKALILLERAVELRPDDPSIRGNFGNALRHAKQFDRAEQQLRRAIEIDSVSPTTRINLVSLLVELNRHEDAAEHVEAVLQAKPDWAPALREKGNILLSRQQYEEAIRTYTRAAELDPQDHLVWHNLATSLQFQGRLEDAQVAYRRAVEVKPDFTESWRQLTGVKKFDSSDFDPQALERNLDNPELGDEQRADLYFGLCKMHADLKHYDQAFACAQAANQIMRQKKPANMDENRTYIDWLIRIFDQSFFAERRDFGVGSDLPVFVLGMPRSGTTLVEQILASHPQVFGAGELKKFHEIIISIPKRLGKPVQNPAAGRLVGRELSVEMAQEYIDFLRAKHPTATRVVDKMPFNFRLLGMIATLLPNAKIIHCRRNPLDVALSCYFARFTEELNFSYNLVDTARYYLDYERLMAHWHKMLPGRIFDVQYEDLVADIEGVSRRLIAHCGLEWDARCLAFHETERTVMTASNWQVRQPLYSSSVGRWRSYEAQLAPLLALLGQGTGTSRAA